MQIEVAFFEALFGSLLLTAVTRSSIKMRFLTALYRREFSDALILTNAPAKMQLQPYRGSNSVGI